MRKVFVCSVLILFVSLVPLWSEGQQEAASGEKMELSVVLHPDWGPTGNELAWTGKPSVLYRRAFPKFNEKYPNIKIVGEEILGDTEGRDKYLLACRQGNSPDVLGIDGFWAAAFATIGATVPLDDLVPQSLLDDYYDAFKLKWEGKTIALVPSTDFNSILWYRKDLFRDAGFGQPPEDWNDLRTYAGKLTNDDMYGLSLSGERSELTTVTVLSFYWQGSDNFLNADGTPAFNNQASEETFNFFGDLYDKGYVPPEIINMGYAGVQQMFFAEKCAMMLHGTWLRSRMYEMAPNLEGNVGLAPNPKNPRTGNYGQNSGGWGIALTTDDKAKREPAAYLLSLIAGLDRDIYKDWLREAGNIPTIKSAAEDPVFRSTEWDKTVMDNLQYSMTRPVHPLYPDASLEWAQAFQEVLLDEKSTKKALSDAVDRAIQIGQDKGFLD